MSVRGFHSWLNGLAVNLFSNSQYWVGLMIDADVLEADHGARAVEVVEARLAAAPSEEARRLLRDLREELRRRATRRAQELAHA
jgi:pyruvate-formate lyase